MQELRKYVTFPKLFTEERKMLPLTELRADLVDRPLYLVQCFVPDLKSLDFAVPIRIEEVRIRLIFAENGYRKCLVEHPNGVRHTHFWRDIQTNQNLFATFRLAQQRFMSQLQAVNSRLSLEEYQQAVRDYEENQRRLEILQGILDQTDTPLL